MPPSINGCYIPVNRARHFAKRASPQEVYEVLENNESPPLWIRTKSVGRSPAYLVYGRTEEGRYLLIPGVVFSEPPLKNMFMPATVRTMTSGERDYYSQNMKGGS
jgi:hypothetical protein